MFRTKMFIDSFMFFCILVHGDIYGICVCFDAGLYYISEP